MKRYKLYNAEDIPAEYLNDVIQLKKFIADNLNILISLNDTYLFWQKVSDYFDAGWLDIDFHYEGSSREEFLLSKLEDYGIIFDCED